MTCGRRSDRMVARHAPPTVDGPVRLWVDRVFTIRGSGTVVTGTLGSGRIEVGDRLQVRGSSVVVRGLQCLGEPVRAVAGVARVAVNLRGIAVGEVGRGDCLLTPGAWHACSELDVRVSTHSGDLPAELLLHLGTAAVPVRVRLGTDTARLVLRRVLPARAGDRGLLRSPSAASPATGVLVLDADPPSLRRRGAARERAAALCHATGRFDVRTEVERRGAVRRSHLAALGVAVDETADVRVAGEWLVAADQWSTWRHRLLDVVDDQVRRDPLAGGIPPEAARRALELPDIALLGPLAAWGLGPRELAAATATGRIVRLPGDIVLLSDGPARALRVLAAIPQPFTTSEARQALGTTRRVAVPLLEHLDDQRWTRRLDSSRREVVDPQRTT